MSPNYILPLLSVIILCLVAYAGVAAAELEAIFGVVIPYIAIVVFMAGFIYRILCWSRLPVPFRIPTTAGQQRSLHWIGQNKIDNPSSGFGVILRMLAEVLLFRSLFRNTKYVSQGDGKASYGMELWLWIAALAFHYSFLVVLIRHLRFFMEPVPACLTVLEKVDGFLQIGLPVVMVSGVVLLAAALYLLLRRIISPQVRYISLASDYFPLFLVLGIAVTGVLMRYFLKADIIGIKELTMGIVTFHPTVPPDISPVFYVHLLFVSMLLAYFPFSKLMHMGGVFFSPTRNLANNNRMKRHINPWNPSVMVHTYEEYEEEFREKMMEAGIPVEKE